MKQMFVALLLALALGGCAATNLQHTVLRSQLTPDRQGMWVRVTRVPDTAALETSTLAETPASDLQTAPRSQDTELRRRLAVLEQKLSLLLQQAGQRPKASAGTGEADARIAVVETRLQSLEEAQRNASPSDDKTKAGQRITALEQRMNQVEQGGSASPDTATVSKRVATIETELQKIEKSSELAVQMGLITTVHSDRNEQGISTVRAELDKLAEDIQSLQMRLAESDKQLEVGLLQLKDLSTKFK